eukprot:CAMPEP_0170141184 /NCGR_PEP_ID=MMETSP0033_2-20121228/6840_1 /TAXON_ID=195969 /ORGANISM="Dolichomastix tenuilepis, Strain CCMP3274" /LENGTH=341 /DNA_ID=CAMNT_0010377435 /DNA_START=44 /DNA_END=1070 /DNA_ORIENTATION=+
MIGELSARSVRFALWRRSARPLVDVEPVAVVDGGSAALAVGDALRTCEWSAPHRHRVNRPFDVIHVLAPRQVPRIRSHGNATRSQKVRDEHAFAPRTLRHELRRAARVEVRGRVVAVWIEDGAAVSVRGGDARLERRERGARSRCICGRAPSDVIVLHLFRAHLAASETRIQKERAVWRAAAARLAVHAHAWMTEPAAALRRGVGRRVAALPDAQLVVARVRTGGYLLEVGRALAGADRDQQAIRAASGRNRVPKPHRAVAAPNDAVSAVLLAVVFHEVEAPAVLSTKPIVAKRAAVIVSQEAFRSDVVVALASFAASSIEPYEATPNISIEYPQYTQCTS